MGPIWRCVTVCGLVCGTVWAGGSPGRYERISSAELRDAIRRRPVAFLPAGIVEWHGEQSACGLDALKAETLCLMAAEAIGGVAFPQTWLGPEGTTPFEPTRYPKGTVSIDKKLYNASAEQLLAGLEAMGFRCAVYLSGHYPGVIPEVAKHFNERGGMKVISISENQVVKGMPAGDHAAAWETSLLMVLRPGLVDLTRLPPLPATTRPAGEVIPPSWTFHQLPDTYGIYGADPRIWANATFGRRGTKAVIEGLAEAIGQALNEKVNAGGFTWPTDDRQQPEVRYDHLLPSQWLPRFEQTPVVFVPLVPADESIEPTVARAVEWARTHGGMVYPPIGYGPAEGGGRLAMQADTYTRIVTEIASDLADMNFRVVVFVGSPTLSLAVRQDLKGMKHPHNQSRFVSANVSSPPPAELDAAIAAMIPKDPTVRVLEGPWQMNDRKMLTLNGALYGEGDPRVYGHVFDCTEAQAASATMLDLGSVENRCEVSLNDGPILVDQWPPYRMLVTGMLKPGPNRLKIGVRHELPPTLTPFFYRVAPPRLGGPVRLLSWTPASGGH